MPTPGLTREFLRAPAIHEGCQTGRSGCGRPSSDGSSRRASCTPSTRPAAYGIRGMTEQLALQLNEKPPRLKRAGALRSFHVRSHQPAAEALAGEERAAKQEEVILGYFRTFAGVSATADAIGGRWTPSEVHAMFPAWPLTSIRRALSNLTARGLLRHYPADRRPGPRGAKESTWGMA